MSTNSKEYNDKVYKKYWGSKKWIKKRVTQNAARKIMERLWKVKKWDWKEVNHIKWTEKWNWWKNLEVISRLKNRIDWQKKAQLAKKKNWTIKS